MKFYVAGPSTYKSLARRYAEALEAEGHECTHRWWETIEQRGEANPVDATREEALAWTDEDLSGVKRSDLLVVLAAGESIGAWFEAGVADMLCIPWVVVHDQYAIPSIFYERAKKRITVDDNWQVIPIKEILE